MGQDSHFNIPLTCDGSIKHVDHIGGRSTQHPRGGSDTMLKSNEPNSITKYALEVRITRGL
jgi:hypothetical protein